MKKLLLLIFLCPTVLNTQTDLENSLSVFDIGLQLGGTGFVGILIEKNFRFDAKGISAAHLRTGITTVFDPMGGGVAVGMPLGASVSFGGSVRFEVGVEVANYLPSYDLELIRTYYPVSVGVRLQK